MAAIRIGAGRVASASLSCAPTHRSGRADGRSDQCRSRAAQRPGRRSCSISRRPRGATARRSRIGSRRWSRSEAPHPSSSRHRRSTFRPTARHLEGARRYARGSTMTKRRLRRERPRFRHRRISSEASSRTGAIPGTGATAVSPPEVQTAPAVEAPTVVIRAPEPPAHRPNPARPTLAAAPHITPTRPFANRDAAATGRERRRRAALVALPAAVLAVAVALGTAVYLGAARHATAPRDQDPASDSVVSESASGEIGAPRPGSHSCHTCGPAPERGRCGRARQCPAGRQRTHPRAGPSRQAGAGPRDRAGMAAAGPARVCAQGYEHRAETRLDGASGATGHDTGDLTSRVCRDRDSNPDGVTPTRF